MPRNNISPDGWVDGVLHELSLLGASFDEAKLGCASLRHMLAAHDNALCVEHNAGLWRRSVICF